LRGLDHSARDTFSGGKVTDTGGERAPAIYSLLGTAKLNGLDPERYLRAVLERIAEHPINRIADLLPWDLKTDDGDEQRLAA